MPESQKILNSKTLVLKFGSSVVTSSKSYKAIADLVISKKSEFKNLVVVVSAPGNMTDQLIFLAKQVHPNPPKREYDMLVSAGERISIALLAMAFDQTGVKALSLTGSQSGIITSEDHSDARILEVRPHRILKALSEDNIVIVAGFQGVSIAAEITTLGRGGSDTTAVALGEALGADRVEFYKDVGGISDKDPHRHCDARFFSYLTYSKAREIIQNNDHAIIESRALQRAEEKGIVLHVRSMIDPINYTEIGPIDKGRLHESISQNTLF